MSRRGGGQHRRGFGPSGFEEAGGYMAAKIAKLETQYKALVDDGDGEGKQGLFSGVAIFVNGYTEPTAEELKRLMMVHGGTYHHYYSRRKTTHIIANNLPDSKVKNMNTDRIVSPKWITDSVKAEQLLDYTKYILYTSQSKTQPKLPFKSLPVPEKSKCEKGSEEEGKSLEQDSLNCPDIDWGSMSETDLLTFEESALRTTKNAADGKSEVNPEKCNMNPSATSGSNTVQSHDSVKSHSMSTANPGFLSEFYNNSRLHHISTMGAMFKNYVNELKNKFDGFPGRESLKSWVLNKSECADPKVSNLDNESLSMPLSNIKMKSKKTIMHIDMDCFFVSVGLRKFPELRGKPVAVTHGRGNPQSQVRKGVDRQYELNYYKERVEKKLKTTASSKFTDTDILEETSDGESDSKSRQTVENTDKKFSSLDLIDDTSSMSEIASCNYEARKAGVKNGMFLGPALKLCPSLQTIPYDFEGYKEVSYKLYDIVASFTHDIEAVSCDEMFVDLTELLQSCQVSPEEFASYLRERVQAETGCPCSAGMGPNMLVARMATRHAKPNGQYLADPEDLMLHMKEHKVTELPGVGWSTGKRLEAEGLITCGDLQSKSLSQLQSLFGPRTGHSLYNSCRGIDNRSVKSEHVRKSVSAEVNYSIRFTNQDDVDKFINELSVEVESRLTAIKMKGKCITLKLKIRAKDAPIETAKFMGHGVCDNVAKSVSLTSASSSAAVINREVLGLLRHVKAPPQDFRGVGIQVSRLEGQPGCVGGVRASGTSIKSLLLGAKPKDSNSTRSSAESIPPKFSVSAERDSKAGESGTSQCTSALGTPSETGHELNANASASKVTSDGKSSIDLEVLLALPEDMRDQVIAEYQQQGYIIPAFSSTRNSDTSNREDEPQPGVSGYVRPKPHIREQEDATGSRNDGASTSKSSISKTGFTVRDCDEGGKIDVPDVGNTGQVAALDRHPRDNDGVEAIVNTNSNSSLGPEVTQDGELLTSFSQVDSSFLDAIPEELIEEIRQDFEHRKQAKAPRPESLQRSPIKQEKSHLTEPAPHRGRRGRWSKTDPRRAEAEGLTTLTDMMLRSPGKTGNLSVRKKIPRGKKKDIPAKSKVPTQEGSLSPSEKSVPITTKEDQLVPADPLTEPTSEPPSAKEGKEEQAEAAASPDLCGVKETGEVKSLIRDWVFSTEMPEKDDTDILSRYYANLVYHQELDKVDCLITYLFRQITRTDNKSWELAYHNVINQVQMAMLNTYNAKLKVKLFGTTSSQQ